MCNSIVDTNRKVYKLKTLSFKMNVVYDTRRVGSRKISKNNRTRNGVGVVIMKGVEVFRLDGEDTSFGVDEDVDRVLEYGSIRGRCL